jgi:hydrid cluster protein-associated redox disulfide domain
MKRKTPLDPELIVDDVMTNWPGAVQVFLRHRMQCVGCELAPFHSLEYAANEHGICEETFLADLAKLRK